MTEHELYRTIGNVDEAFLLECEKRPVRRVPKRFGLIAAVIALMLTACAAPGIVRNFKALKKGNIVQGMFDQVVPIEILGDGTVLKSATISTSGSMALQVERAKGAPSTIKEYYIPTDLIDRYTVESCAVDDTCLMMEFSGKGIKGRELYDILYRQYVIPESGYITIDCFSDAGMFMQSQKTVGDTVCIEVSGSASFEKVMWYADGRKLRDQSATGTGIKACFLFWSDGLYVYCVKMPMVPPHTGNQAVENMINSLTQIADIAEYLTDTE